LQSPAYANAWALRRYVPEPYAGNVLMVNPSAPIAGMVSLPQMGWGGLIEGRTEVIDAACEANEIWWREEILVEVARVIGDRLAGSNEVAVSKRESTRAEARSRQPTS